MQIQHHLHTSGQPIDKLQQVKDGEIYRATVKEQTGKDEAVLSIRGREVNVKFDGEFPKTDRISIQVVNASNDVVVVKAIEESRSIPQAQKIDRESVSQSLRSLGVQQPTTELRQAVAMIMEKGMPLSKEAVSDLQKFLNEGKTETRLQTVQAVVNKRLDITPTILRSVHESLHGRPLNEVLNDLAKEMDRDFKVEAPVRERTNQSSDLVNVTDRNQSNNRGSQELQVSSNARQNQVTSIQDQLNQAKDLIIKDPSVSRAADRVQQTMNRLDPDSNRVIERAVTESKYLDQVSKDRVLQVLNQSVDKTNPVEQGIVKEANKLIQREGLTQPVRDQIDKLTREGFAKDIQEQVSKVLKQSEQLQENARTRLAQAVNQVTTNLTSNVVESTVLQEAITESKNVLQKEANYEKAVQKIDLLFNTQSGSVKSELLQVLETAKEFQQQGREIKARQEIAAFINRVEEQIKSTEVNRPQMDNNAYINNELFQTSVNMSSKSIAVTTVTEKLAQMTSDFKQLQREISRNLDQVNRQIEQFRNLAQPVAKPLLETTIKKLDQAILKSEMMQLADMKTEKQLMVASSQLAEAKKLLSRGKHTEANRIVQDVKQLVDKLIFQPSDTKVKHYTAASEKALSDMQLPRQAFASQYSDLARGPIQEGSPRAMFEMVRTAGLNRDSELAQLLVSNRELQDSSERNLKSTLMQLARGEDEGSRAQQLASQALSNVTGQQLLSRSDQQGNLQSMVLQLPFLLEDKVENLQVFVNSRNEGQQVDWENCSLYFLMETPKMGEIGISVSAIEKQLSVTIKNDNQDFQFKMAPLVQMTVENLTEIGYSINGIKYAQLTTEEKMLNNEQQEQKLRQQPVYTEKGFDFKI
ncbi:hypothetical protein [Halalkalibacter akibai]|uniref:Metal-dependent peptidase n=1 Tax=Halalkalibacter akibai (strain ATCC 43226 / DSM 21942 / CIP 109018 / JCM 9157 / 1139) TaxID=1236973 RepID=W4QQ95_HALA3|nr:hypothetical protein [Halalkalibacter akibai]GAE33499.1 hypothetical protein JCM9157_503 [Halalkalibacter akibai JCM 9157]